MLRNLKNVGYVGFESHPDLKPLAERATTALAGVIKDWWDTVVVTWSPAPPDFGADLALMLYLALPNASGSATGHLRRRDFDPGEEGGLRWKLRETWLGLLDNLLAGMAANREEAFSEPIEAWPWPSRPPNRSATLPWKSGR